MQRFWYLTLLLLLVEGPNVALVQFLKWESSTDRCLIAAESGFHHASPSRADSTVEVGYYWNLQSMVPHTALALDSQKEEGLNPQSKKEFALYKPVHLLNGPGIKGQMEQPCPKNLVSTIRIPVEASQARKIQDLLDQTIQNPPRYDIYGRATTCDCASLAWRILSDAKVDAGPVTLLPWVLQWRLEQRYGKTLPR